MDTANMEMAKEKTQEKEGSSQHAGDVELKGTEHSNAQQATERTHGTAKEDERP